MESIQITFGKDKTAIIKGFAIVFMILLHVFGGSGWYEGDIPMNHNEGLIRFMHSFQICVGIFVFMIGYGYAFAKQKDWWYSLKHVKSLLTSYWAVLFLFALPAGYMSVGGGRNLLLNMFGIDETLTWVSWFVYLYLWAMVVMPLAGRLVDRKPYIWVVLLTLLSFVAQTAIWYFVPGFNNHLWWHALMVCVGWTPTILLGYLCARKGLFQKVRLSNHWSVPVVAILVVALILYLKMVLPGIKIFNFDTIYAPVIILCIVTVFSQYEMPWFKKVMAELGDKSVYMWFVHALFFCAATRPVYHQFVIFTDNLWLVALWTIVLSYMLSALIKKIVEI